MSDETRSLRAFQAKDQPELELFEGGMRKEAVKELQKMLGLLGQSKRETDESIG